MPDKPTARRAPPQVVSYVPNRAIAIVLYVYALAVLGRTLAWFAGAPEEQHWLPWVIGLELAYLALYALLQWRSSVAHYRLPPAWLHVYFTAQVALVIVIILLEHRMDFVPGLFVPLSYQVAVHLRGHTRRAWIAVFVLLTVIPLMLIYDPLRNLALGMPNMAGCVVLAAYIAASQEDDSIRARNMAMLAELQETNRQLQLYAGQVEELAALEERNRLARELHDSVSQTMFSIILNVRTAQILVERDPARLPQQLEVLHGLAQSALADMRGLIIKLRPKSE